MPRSPEDMQVVDGDAFVSPWPGGYLPIAMFTTYILVIVLTGVCSSRLIRYLARYGGRGKDKLWNQLLVCVMWSTLMTQAGLSCETLSEQVMQNLDDPFGVEWTATLAVIFIPIVLAQIWATHRVWSVSHNSVKLTGAVAAIVSASVASYLAFLTLRARQDAFHYEGSTRRWYLAYAITTFIADSALSIAFVTSCLRLRQQTFDARTKRSLSIMASIAVQGSVLTTLCSLGMMIAALASTDTAILTAFQNLLPALNTIAVLHTLLSRNLTTLEKQNNVKHGRVLPGQPFVDGYPHVSPRPPCSECSTPQADAVPVFTVVGGVQVHVERDAKSECEKDYETGLVF